MFAHADDIARAVEFAVTQAVTLYIFEMVVAMVQAQQPSPAFVCRSSLRGEEMALVRRLTFISSYSEILSN